MPTTARVRPFDLETTGIDPATDRIVTAYLGELDEDGNIMHGQEWLVAPDGYTIPDGAAAIHGISTEHAAANGRPMAEVLGQLVTALTSSDAPLGGHNLAYDLTLLAHELERRGHPDPVALITSLRVVDTFVLDKFLDTYRRGKRTLTAIAPLYGVDLSDEDAHGAAADAVAAARVALAQLKRPALSALTFEQLHALQKREARAQTASFIAFRRRTDPSFTTDANWPLRQSALDLTRTTAAFTF